MVRPQAPPYRNIVITPERLAAALAEKQGGAFVGAEACSTQSGRVWYWYCLEDGLFSETQYVTERLATTAAEVYDATFHVGRRQ